ncbi:hypothetical protein [Chromohalobacter canadensis]|uniref:Uncharacterized protein n=1 Tax=Chromohalobacter canadensis TaxID=141389 RepID=A0ABZ0YBD5_9GAMM|nr:hypothetical protein [Chromohalobacter canadensis]MCK0768099.1 hypothetical protein [Chromohalobacter canadensis]WQH08662.1 hypothetical protein SR908_14475 [Chromohalobacter canadensis]
MVNASARKCPHCGVHKYLFLSNQEALIEKDKARQEEKGISSYIVSVLGVLALAYCSWGYIVPAVQDFETKDMVAFFDDGDKKVGSTESAGISSSDSNSPNPNKHPIEIEESPNSAPFRKAEICRAGVAAAMGRSYSITQIDGTQGSVYYVSYTRPQDGKQWRYRCKIDDNTIIWASIDGRWRTHPLDGVIRFAVDENVLKIIEAYKDRQGEFGSGTTTLFEKQGKVVKEVET